VWALGRASGHLILPLLFILLFVAAFRGRVTATVLSSRWITNIGGMCYTIYLFHFLMISAIGRVTKPIHFGQSFLAYYLLQAVLVLPCVFAGCCVFFILIERPCMNPQWPRELIRFFRPAACGLAQGQGSPVAESE
jgi:peptidoglycan/LPS O-acetylase OafA/YrhL